MSYDVEGIVDKYNTRQLGNGKTAYSLLVRQEGEEDGSWYGFYTNNPGDCEGKVVSFRATDKGNFKNADAKSFKVVGEATAAQQVVKKPAASRAGRGGTFDNRQASIVMQSSSKTAVDLLNLMVASDAVHLGAAKGEKAAQKRYDALMELYEELTIRLYNRATQPERFHEHVTANILGTGAGEDVEDASEGQEEEETPSADGFKDF
jgi:hypothetical protein